MSGYICGVPQLGHSEAQPPRIQWVQGPAVPVLEIDGHALHDSLPRGKSECSLRLSGKTLVARMPSGEMLKLDLRQAELVRGGSDGSDFVFSSTVLGGPTFVTKDRELYRAATLACPAVAASHGKPKQARRRRLSRFQWAILAVATAVVATVLGAVLLIGPLARVALRFFPRSVDISIGQTAYPNALRQISFGAGSRDEPGVREPIQTVLDRLTAALPNSPFTFHVTVCNSPMLNAFALPGGEILVTSRMVVSLQSSDELAAVLAHEISHVLRRHTMEMTIRASGMRFLIHVLSGGHWATGIASTVWGAATLMEHSREKESDADQQAVHLLADAGVDPQALLAMFDRLAAEEPTLPAQAAATPSGRFFEKMRSHPNFSQRKANVETELAKIKPPSAQPIDVDYPALVKAVKADGAVNLPRRLPDWLNQRD